MVKTSDCGSDMRGFESHYPPHKKDFGICQGLFYLSDEDENPFEGSCILLSSLLGSKIL